MHAHEHVLPIADVAFDQRDVVLAVELVHVAVCAELAVLGGEQRACLAGHEVVVVLAVALQLLDRDDRQVVALCHAEQLGRAHHRAVVAHDLAAQAHLLEAGQPEQVDGGLGVAVALEHAVFLGEQREHVAGTAEVERRGVVVDGHARRVAALFGRDARRRVHVVDGHGEGGLVVVGVVRHHLRQLQLAHVLLAHGHADEALRVACHEVDVLGRGVLRGADEVALVLAVGVVDDEDHLARLERLYRLGDGVVVGHDRSFSLKAVFG